MWSYFNSESGVKLLGTGKLLFGGYFNSSISGVIFTPGKLFFKLLFGVKIIPCKEWINPSRGVIISPWNLLCRLTISIWRVCSSQKPLTKTLVNMPFLPIPGSVEANENYRKAVARLSRLRLEISLSSLSNQMRELSSGRFLWTRRFRSLIGVIPNNCSVKPSKSM